MAPLGEMIQIADAEGPVELYDQLRGPSPVFPVMAAHLLYVSKQQQHPR
jgi:hypothetical protein